MAFGVMPTLDPATLALLSAKGIVPPPQVQTQPDFGSTLANAGLQAPGATPPPPPQAPAAPPPPSNFGLPFSAPSQTPASRQPPLPTEGAGGVPLDMSALGENRQAENKPYAGGSTDWTKPSPGAGGEAGAMAQPHYATVPAHEVRQVSPEAEARMSAAEGEKKAAAGQASGAEQGVAAAEAAGAGEQAAALGSQEEGAQRREAGRTKALAGLDAERSAMQRDYASGKPDYDRYYKGNGGLNRVVAAVAQALGAAGQVFGHTSTNTAMEIINKKVDADVAEQRDDLAKKGDALKGKGEQLRDLRAKFGDERAAEAAMRVIELDKVKLHGQQMVGEAKSTMIAAKWQGVVADIDQEAAVNYQKAHAWANASTVQTGGGAQYSDVKPDEVMQLGDGRYVTVPEKDREKVRDTQAKADSVAQAGAEVKRLSAIPIAERLAHPIEWKRAFDASSKVLSAADIEGGGGRGKGMFDAYQKAIGGRTLTLLTPGVSVAVDQIVNAAQRGAHNQIENSAQYEVRPELVPNQKTGIIERKHVIVRPFERPKQVTPPTIEPAKL